MLDIGVMHGLEHTPIGASRRPRPAQRRPKLGINGSYDTSRAASRPPHPRKGYKVPGGLVCHELSFKRLIYRLQHVCHSLHW